MLSEIENSSGDILRWIEARACFLVRNQFGPAGETDPSRFAHKRVLAQLRKAVLESGRHSTHMADNVALLVKFDCR